MAGILFMFFGRFGPDIPVYEDLIGQLDKSEKTDM